MAQPQLITLTDPRSAAAEAYRMLRANLVFGSADRPLVAFVVTSAATADDKSAAVANLAVTFAQAGNRTILVDADLRRPSQADLWGVDAARGLATLMADDAALANPPLAETVVPNLSLLPAGPLPPVPADFFASQRMNEVIGLLKARASYVLFDAPPVLAASDAALLGAKLDGVLLVVRAGHTRRDHANRARQALERVNARVLGAALTNARHEGDGLGYR